MKFTVEREHLLKPLQQVSGPLGGRPTLPILGNLLLQVADGTLSLTGTDLEMEMIARVTLTTSRTWTTGKVKSNSPCRRRR